MVTEKVRGKVGGRLHCMSSSFSRNGFLKKSLFIFRQRGREGGREGEKHQCVVAS